DLVVFALRVGVGAILLELADIRAGYERLVAGPGEHDDADGPVLLELIQDLTQADPHFYGNGVALFRLVEGDETDAVILRRQHLSPGEFPGRGMVRQHLRSLPSCAYPPVPRRCSRRPSAHLRCALRHRVCSCALPWKNRRC